MEESATEQARAFFYRNECYTADKLEADYHAELEKYSDDTWEAPQRAARLAAAVKRYKTSEMLRFILDTVAPEADPDLTPLVVKRLCNALFGRTGSQAIIVSVFGQKGRVHRSADSAPDIIEQVAARYRPAAQRYWITTLANIERVKRGYQAKIRTSRNTGAG
ncbi:hypothetical protein [Photorhabdus stackebrandtii]|uniref:Cytoplasmic protein n=1 Tax=Photorhabdus stackebrandtii TaxID=1123042 RepID=A0A7X5QQM9_9GAMM|nr:hypothetical protein [Photorhabdus stackebrandtii]NHB98549.1 hypothetical protein [Photorhabdus stackebrandtii]